MGLSVKRFIGVAAALVCALVLVSSASAFAAGEDQAKAYIQKLGADVLATVQSKKLSQQQKNSKLESYFNTHVDIDWVGRFATGRFWKQATDAQKARYLKEYRRFIISHYTARFNEYTGGGFEVTDARDDGNNEYTVSMKVGTEKPIMLDYRVRRQGGGFRIFDLNIEGVSMITTQRSEFTSLISSKGMDALSDELNRKTSAIVKTGNADAS
jgi:phospholipid transport system substrate-binding protein